MLRSLPSFVNPDVHASERNTEGEGENATLESESGSNAEKEDEVRVGVGGKETVTSCVPLFYYAVYSSSFKISRRTTNGDTPEHLEGQPKDGEPVHTLEMV